MGVIGVVCFGDVVGRPGRLAVKAAISKLRQQGLADLIVVNGENASGGIGLELKEALELHRAGADVVTLGDHSFNKGLLKAEQDWQQAESFCVRPANYPKGHAGKGWLKIELAKHCRIGVFNLEGRVFMNNSVSCPFEAADSILARELADCPIRICDFHAEATSEKVGLGHYLDGRISLFVGTHTHVQTADEQILEAGTGYITDLGMCGVQSAVIGMDKDAAISRLRDAKKKSYKISKGTGTVCGIIAQIDTGTGKCLKIERIRE